MNRNLRRTQEARLKKGLQLVEPEPERPMTRRKIIIRIEFLKEVIEANQQDLKEIGIKQRRARICLFGLGPAIMLLGYLLNHKALAVPFALLGPCVPLFFSIRYFDQGLDCKASLKKNQEELKDLEKQLENKISSSQQRRASWRKAGLG